MNIATFEGEVNLDTLLQRILGNKQTPESRERLLELNPHLASLSELPTGTPILIPDTIAAPADDRAQGIDAIAEAIEDAVAQREETFKQREAAMQEAERILANEIVESLLSTNPELKARLSAVKKEFKMQRDAIATDRKSFQTDITNLRASIGIATKKPRRRAVGHG